MPVQEPFIFLFTGDEFLRRSEIDSFLDRFIPDSLRETNLFRFYADDLDWPRLLVQARTPSLMGGVQAFWVSQADQLKKGDWAGFESYCLKPAHGCSFIFEADELAASHPLTKLASRFGKQVHSNRQNGDNGLELLRAKLKRFGKTMTPEAWQILEERLGASVRLMDLALDQLILYSQGPAIDETSVRELAGEFLRYEPFDLTEALARKDVSEALKMFHFFYDLSGDLTSVVGLIHWQLKRIWQAKKMFARGAKQNEIGRTLRIPPFRLASFMNQIQRFEIGTVEELLRKLWQIDWDAKRGASQEAVAMEMFLVESGTV